LSDTPLSNPWSEAEPETLSYLTYSSEGGESSCGPKECIFEAEFYLDDIFVKRSRTVYDVITLVSEVSGFADIFFVLITYILGVLYTPFQLESALLEHMGHVLAARER